MLANAEDVLARALDVFVVKLLEQRRLRGAVVGLLL